MFRKRKEQWPKSRSLLLPILTNICILLPDLFFSHSCLLSVHDFSICSSVLIPTPFHTLLNLVSLAHSLPTCIIHIGLPPQFIVSSSLLTLFCNGFARGNLIIDQIGIFLKDSYLFLISLFVVVHQVEIKCNHGHDFISCYIIYHTSGIYYSTCSSPLSQFLLKP